MTTIKKEDFEVYDKHLNNDGGAYKKLTGNRFYNDEMYKEALNLSNDTQSPNNTNKPEIR